MLTPSPKLPASGETVTGIRNIDLSWTRSGARPVYHLQIAKDEGFAELALDINLADTTHAYKPQSFGKYYWRVRAQRGEKQSAWSPVRRFGIQPNAISESMARRVYR